MTYLTTITYYLYVISLMLTWLGRFIYIVNVLVNVPLKVVVNGLLTVIHIVAVIRIIALDRERS